MHTYIHTYTLYTSLINPLECFSCIEGHVALDRNPGPGYDTLLLRHRYSFTIDLYHDIRYIHLFVLTKNDIDRQTELFIRPKYIKYIMIKITTIAVGRPALRLYDNRYHGAHTGTFHKS